MISGFLLTLLLFLSKKVEAGGGGDSKFYQAARWFMGYDTSVANPFPSPDFYDKGYKQPIFKFTHHAEGSPSIPDHTDFHRDLRCTGKIDVAIIDTY